MTSPAAAGAELPGVGHKSPGVTVRKSPPGWTSLPEGRGVFGPAMSQSVVSRGSGQERATREDIMEILEAHDLTGGLGAGAELAGCGHKTVGASSGCRDWPWAG